MFEGLWNRIKNWWNRQPEIIVYQPIQINSNPEPIPFEVNIQGQKTKGLILRIDETPRVISKRGDSFQISIRKNWVQYLPPSLPSFLIQVQDKIGIVFMPEEGEKTG